MFIEDAHILRASSDTVCACISKRPAIARIACGSVIKRVGIAFSLSRNFQIVEVLFCCDRYGGSRIARLAYGLTVNCSPQSGDISSLLFPHQTTTLGMTI